VAVEELTAAQAVQVVTIQLAVTVAVDLVDRLAGAQTQVVEADLAVILLQAEEAADRVLSSYRYLAVFQLHFQQELHRQYLRLLQVIKHIQLRLLADQIQ
jgi:hypothetical protein